jgi:hypothetical protein
MIPDIIEYLKNFLEKDPTATITTLTSVQMRRKQPMQ